MPEDIVCFIGQKALIERDGEVLILHDPQTGLDLPGGKIQEQETDLATALKREVMEETGLTITVGSPFYSWFYTVPLNSGHRSAGKKIFNVAYKCSYVSGEMKLSSEHDWYKWTNKNSYTEYSNSSFFPVLQAYFAAVK